MEHDNAQKTKCPDLSRKFAIVVSLYIFGHGVYSFIEIIHDFYFSRGISYVLLKFCNNNMQLEPENIIYDYLRHDSLLHNTCVF